MAFQYANVNSGGMSTHYHARSLRKSNIYTILVKELCLLYDYAGKVSWMHQHFRDAMAAIYLYEMAQTGDNIGLALWKDKMDPYVENFLGNLLQAEKNGNTWDRIWYLYKSSNEPSDPEFIERMLRIYRVAYGRNISHIDFSGIDLGNVSLSNYVLDESSKRHFVNTKIEKSLFFDDGHQMGISSISWDKDGNRYLSASRDCNIKIWDEKGQRKFMDLESPHNVYIRDAKWNPVNNNQFVSAGDDQIVFLWNYNKKWDIRELGACENWIYSINWSSNGERVICGDKEGNISVFSIHKVNMKRFHYKKKQIVRSVVFLDDGFFASGTDDGTLCIWNEITGEPIVHNVMTSSIINLYWISQERVLIIITKKGGYYCNLDFNTNSIMNLQRFCEGDISASAMNTCSNTLYCALFMPNAISIYRGIRANNNSYRIFNYIVHSMGVKDIGIVACGAWNNSCNKIVIGTNNGGIWCADIVEGEENHDRIIITKSQNSNTCSVRCSAWNQTGRYLIAGYDDCAVRLWDMKEKRCKSVFYGHQKSVKCVAWGDNGFFYSGANDGRVLEWNIKQGLCKELLNSESPVNCILIKEHRLFTGDDNGNVLLYDLKKRKITSNGKVNTQIYSQIITSDGKYLISGGDDRVLYLWNIEGDIKLIDAVCSGHEKEIRGMAFSGNLDGIYTGANDNKLRYRKFNASKSMINNDSEIIEGQHRDFIYSVTLSGNGRYVITGSTDSNVGFWDAYKNEFISLGEEHKGFIWNVSSGQIGNKYYVASSSSDGTIRIWDVTQLNDKKEVESEEILITIPNISIIGCDFTDAIINDEWLRKTIYMNGGTIGPDSITWV